MAIIVRRKINTSAPHTITAIPHGGNGSSDLSVEAGIGCVGDGDGVDGWMATKKKVKMVNKIDNIKNKKNDIKNLV